MTKDYFLTKVETTLTQLEYRIQTPQLKEESYMDRVATVLEINQLRVLQAALRVSREQKDDRVEREV